VRSAFPESPAERDRWILARRNESDRHALDPGQPYAFFVEKERSAHGRLVPVAALFLTNRECPWHCLMCDLWRNTLTSSVPVGAIPAQIDFALSRLGPAEHIKLYNSGSFFDPRAIPNEDHAAIAGRLNAFDLTIVESHPALIGDDTFRFRDRLSGSLEVALGLETVHPVAGPRLNKRMSLEQYASASAQLSAEGISVRAFVLVKPPFIADETEALEWADQSVRFAFECGASVVSLIPTRGTEGALQDLQASGSFDPPALATLESALASGIELGKGRVFADIWDLKRFSNCPACFQDRWERMNTMNLHQEIPDAQACGACGNE